MSRDVDDYIMCMDEIKRADEFHKEQRKDNWHIGTPTEEGDYVVICEYTMNNYMARTRTIWAFKNGRWDNSLERFFKDFKIIAWYGQKIDPYKEKEK